jgi:hypothetical protein
MKFVGILVAAAVAIYLGILLAFPSYTHRYRLTIEFDTPAGVRSGSSVIEVTRKDVRWILIAQGRYEFDVRGEAVFVDLGANKNVIGLLTHGPNGGSGDGMISLPIEAYGYYRWDEAAWAGKAKMEGPVEIKPPLIPTLVTFTDLTDPNTGQVVYAVTHQSARRARRKAQSVVTASVDRIKELLGPDVSFRRALVEHLAPSAWSFGRFYSANARLTQQIEQKIPFLITHRDQLRRLIDSTPSRFQPHYGYFKRER